MHHPRADLDLLPCLLQQWISRLTMSPLSLKTVVGLYRPLPASLPILYVYILLCSHVLVTDSMFQLLSVTSNAALFDLTPRFLDSSLHTFFTKFIPILPLIHRPTFVYRECSAPLLLNAISLGSLFIGTNRKVSNFEGQGECLWRLAHTAIATAWPDMIGHQRDYDTCSGVELILAALLSQSYAAFSKVRFV